MLANSTRCYSKQQQYFIIAVTGNEASLQFCNKYESELWLEHVNCSNLILSRLLHFPDTAHCDLSSVQYRNTNIDLSDTKYNKYSSLYVSDQNISCTHKSYNT